jgi:NAD(P)-dependent dehydrogenase (short-subunit alcohol dehydrogenase family)
VIGGMRERRYGRIVNVSSIAAIGTTLPGNAFYAATKAEVVSLTRRFALELGSYGITVNAVAPGFVRTDLSSRPEESHLRALPEPYVNLSIHTAPDVRPLP